MTSEEKREIREYLELMDIMQNIVLRGVMEQRAKWSINESMKILVRKHKKQLLDILEQEVLAEIQARKNHL